MTHEVSRDGQNWS